MTLPPGFRSGSGIRCPTSRFWMPRPRASLPVATRSPARPSAWCPTFALAAKLREFFLQWLKVDQYPDIAKDPKLFPEFNEVDRVGPADLARPLSR